MCAISTAWCVVAGVLCFATAPIVYSENGTDTEKSYFWREIVGYFVSIPFEIYFLVVVLSFHNKLKFEYSPTPQVA